jgi:hypothetical protein
VSEKTTGRPPAELRPERRRELVRLRASIKRSETKLGRLQTARAIQAALAVDEGASHRAIAEALGVDKATARSYAARGAQLTAGEDADR